MIYTVDLSQKLDLQIIPESEEQAILQELYCLLTTAVSEVPCYRNFGLNMSYISRPLDVAKTMMAAAIATAIAEFMPELTVANIQFSAGDSADGLIPRIEVKDSE